MTNRVSGTVLCLVLFETHRGVDAAWRREAGAVALVLALALAVGVAVVETRHSRSRSRARLLSDAGSLLMVAALLSPVLGTLTSAYATNTVENLIAGAFALHLLATDLRVDAAPVSLNAAFAAVILLASRFQHSAVAFGFSVACAAVLSATQATAPSTRRTVVLGLAALASSLALLPPLVPLCYVLAVLVLRVWAVRVLDSALARRTPLHGPWEELRVEEEEERGVVR